MAILDQNDAASLSEVGRLLKEQDELFAALEAEEETLMAPIRDRIQAIHRERRKVGDDYSVELGIALGATTFDDLTDPFRAMEFFAASWNSGRGVPTYGDTRSRSNIYRDIFEGAYIFDAETYEYGESRLIYMAPRIAIPAVKDEEKLARTAELLAPVHMANMEILGELDEAKIPIFDDSYYGDSHKITLDLGSGEWILASRYGHEVMRSEALIDVLRAAPTYE